MRLTWMDAVATVLVGASVALYFGRQGTDLLGHTAAPLRSVH